MKLNYGMVSAAALALGMSGCSALNKNVETETVVKEIIKQPPPIIETTETVYNTAKVEATVSSVPEWFTELPTDDEIIFTVGTSTAPDLQLAIDIATLNAKVTLADRINGKLDSMTKSFISKIGQTDIDTAVLTEIEKVSKNVVASVDVAGYAPSKLEVFPSGTQYRAFVLLEYSDKEALKIMMNRYRKDRMVFSKIKSTNAWKELEEEVNDSKAEDEAQSLTNVESLIDEKTS